MQVLHLPRALVVPSQTSPSCEVFVKKDRMPLQQQPTQVGHCTIHPSRRLCNLEIGRLLVLGVHRMRTDPPGRSRNRFCKLAESPRFNCRCRSSPLYTLHQHLLRSTIPLGCLQGRVGAAVLVNLMLRHRSRLPYLHKNKLFAQHLCGEKTAIFLVHGHSLHRTQNATKF